MRKICLIFFLSLTFALTSCQGSAENGDINELRIALLVDDGSPESGRVFEDFRTGLADYIGMPVRIIEGATHLVGIEAMRAGNLDVMWSSPFVYLLAWQTTEVVRLAVTNSPLAVNKTVFITNQDDIHSLEDLPGRTFAFISTASTSGFVYPMYHLMNMFDMTRDEVLTGGLFSAVTYSGSQDASIMGVFHGDIDVAAVGNLNLASIINSGIINESDVRIIAYTEVIPFPGYIASKRLPESLINKIQEFILAYDNEGYFLERFNDANVRFVLPDPAHINHLRSMAEALDIDLESH